MILGTRHTGIVVRDLEISLKFYRDILGLSVWKRAKEEGSFIEKIVGLSGVSLEWVKMQAPDGSLVELLQYHSHPDAQPFEKTPSNRLGCSHIAFTVDNLEEVYNLLHQHGYHCNSSPQVSPDGKVKVLYSYDPDGIIVELVEELIPA